MSKTEWKEYRLGEIYEVHNGLSKGREFFGSGYPFISFSTVFNKWFIPEIIEIMQRNYTFSAEKVWFSVNLCTIKSIKTQFVSS